MTVTNKIGPIGRERAEVRAYATTTGKPPEIKLARAGVRAWAYPTPHGEWRLEEWAYYPGDPGTPVWYERGLPWHLYNPAGDHARSFATVMAARIYLSRWAKYTVGRPVMELVLRLAGGGGVADAAAIQSAANHGELLLAAFDRRDTGQFTGQLKAIADDGALSGADRDAAAKIHASFVSGEAGWAGALRIRLNATIEIGPEHLARAREFMAADTNQDLRVSLQAEALGYLVEYLTSNMIPVVVLRGQF
jgi:hypothetical protein